MTAVVVLNLASTWALTGLVWIVQRVHYPAFAHVVPGQFAAFHAMHSRRIGTIVVPLMLVELVTSVWLAIDPPFAARTFRAAALAVAAVWASTFLLQVPGHRRLARGFDAAAHAALVRTNWVRTVLWTARGVGLLAAILARASL